MEEAGYDSDATKESATSGTETCYSDCLEGGERSPDSFSTAVGDPREGSSCLNPLLGAEISANWSKVSSTYNTDIIKSSKMTSVIDCDSINNPNDSKDIVNTIDSPNDSKELVYSINLPNDTKVFVYSIDLPNDSENIFVNSIDSPNVREDFVNTIDSPNDSKNFVNTIDSPNDSKVIVNTIDSPNDSKYIVNTIDSPNVREDFVNTIDSPNDSKNFVNTIDSPNDSKVIVNSIDSPNDSKDIVKSIDSTTNAKDFLYSIDLPNDTKVFVYSIDLPSDSKDFVNTIDSPNDSKVIVNSIDSPNDSKDIGNSNNHRDLAAIKIEVDADDDLSAWGATSHDDLTTSIVLEEDKKDLHQLLGIEDKKINAKEFTVSSLPAKRKRGRPRKIVSFNRGPLAVVGEDTSRKNLQPSRADVEQYLEELKKQIMSEKEGQEKKRGRPQNFDHEQSQKKKLKIKKKDASELGVYIPIEPTLKTGMNDVPKRRGRTPKPKSAEDLLPKEKKKRRRPAKPEDHLLPKIPKKRSKKPRHDVGSDNAVNDAEEHAGLTPRKPRMIHGYKKRAKTPQLNEGELIEKGLRMVHASDPILLWAEEYGEPSNVWFPTTPNVVSEHALPGNPGDKRPRTGFEKPRDGPRDLKKKEAEETEKRALKKKRDHEMRSQHLCVNDPTELRSMEAKMKEPDYVPAYKPRLLYSCGVCQSWSWNLKTCSNCFHAVPPASKFLRVEQHEVMSEKSDRARPFYHPPPVPYLKPGLVTFCPGCFYYSPTADVCSECSYRLPSEPFSVHVDFEGKVAEDPDVEVVPFRSRLVGDDLMECPFCGLSCLREGPCAQCGKTVPLNVTVVPDDPSKPWNLKWPTVEMIKSGTISLPENYVPLFRVGTVTMCRWCCSMVWDLNRCPACHRKLPPCSDLLPDGPGYDHVDCVEARRPNFSDPPVPYLRPGKMAICANCGDYSKDLKICDRCGKHLLNRKIVLVSFGYHPTAYDDPRRLKRTVLWFIARKVNSMYTVCPHCEFSTTNPDQCTVCGKDIPQSVTVTPSLMGRKKKERAGPNKPASVLLAESTLAGKIEASKGGVVTKKKKKKPQNYVPRFRERGVAQCPSCQAWTWDFDRCSACHAEVQTPGELPLVIYPTEALRDRTVEDMRPRFEAAPLPYLRPGRVTMCKACFCYTLGPPFCSECGKLLEQDPQFVTIDFAWGGDTDQLPQGSRVLAYIPRTTAYRKLTLCPFCGYTTENSRTCSFCEKNIPKSCLIIPENPMVYSLEYLLKHLDSETKNKTESLASKSPPSLFTEADLARFKKSPKVTSGSMASVSLTYSRLHKALIAANLIEPTKFVSSTPKTNVQSSSFNLGDSLEQSQRASPIVPLIDLE